MTDCTLAAPARATKAPARSKAAPSPAPADEAPQQRPEWLSLGLMHTRRLCEMLYTLVDSGDNGKAQGLIQALVEAAESHLYTIAREDSCVDASVEGALCSQINMMALMLEGAWYAAEHGPLDYPPPLHEAVIPAAIVYANGLAEALMQAPLTDKLHELTSPPKTAGARQFRDRPTPPIRRAPAAAYTITRNDPGEILFGDRDELERFVVQGADTLASLNVCLSSLVSGIGHSGPDYGFIADFATHVSDLTYEHQNALQCLLGKGEAA